MELRNVEADLSRFRTRVFVFTVLVLVCFFLLLCRLVYLQVWRHDDLRSEQAHRWYSGLRHNRPCARLPVADRGGVECPWRGCRYNIAQPRQGTFSKGYLH